MPSARILDDYKQIRSRTEISMWPLYEKFQLKISYLSWHHYKKFNWLRMAKPHLNFFWWSRILFQLRPLFFGYKNRQQITKFFIETLNHLFIAATAFYGFKVSPSGLWQKSDAIMADVTTNNLQKFICIITKLPIQVNTSTL